jgi:hypothetical protein
MLINIDGYFATAIVIPYNYLYFCNEALHFLMALQPLWTLAAFQSPDLFTIGRTRTSDQLFVRPLPKYRTA